MNDSYPFTKWNGGFCPVKAGTKVELIHRDGQRRTMLIDYPTRWNHLGTPCDIVAYRVVQPNAGNQRSRSDPLD
jgi:hypothetical protein